MLGITIRFSAAGRTLTGAQGEVLDLSALDRRQLSDVAHLVSGAAGIREHRVKQTPRPPRSVRNAIRKVSR